MFILYAIVIGLIVGLASGGRLRHLARIEFAWAPLILVGFLAQVLLFSDAVAERIGEAGPPLYVASTLLVGAAIVRNARIAGLPLVAAGALSNMAAILANGGYMPATEASMASLGKAAPTIYSNSAIVARPALEPLIDRFALPPWLPFTNVFSVGDVLLGIGVVILIVVGMRRETPPEPERPSVVPSSPSPG
jgi:hypothetical protein